MNIPEPFHVIMGYKGAFSVITNLRMELFEALLTTRATAAERRRDPLITMLNPYLFCSAGWPGGSSV